MTLVTPPSGPDFDTTDQEALAYYRREPGFTVHDGTSNPLSPAPTLPAWVASVSYKTGQEIRVTNGVAVAQSDHVSGSTYAADLAAGKWKEAGSGTSTAGIISASSLGFIGDGTTDNATAWAAARTALANGGHLKFGTGIFATSSFGNWDDLVGVTISGEASRDSNVVSTVAPVTELRYTGTGSSAGWSFRHSWGCKFAGIEFSYSQSTFTGTLLDLRYSPTQAATFALALDRCTFRPKNGTTDNATYLVDIEGVVEALISDCSFLGGGYGLHGAGGFANAVTITGGRFADNRTGAISGLGQQWKLTNVVFEPLVGGQINHVQGGPGPVTFDTCYWWDSSSAGTAIQWSGNGLKVDNCEFALGTGTPTNGVIQLTSIGVGGGVGLPCIQITNNTVTQGTSGNFVSVGLNSPPTPAMQGFTAYGNVMLGSGITDNTPSLLSSTQTGFVVDPAGRFYSSDAASNGREVVNSQNVTGTYTIPGLSSATRHRLRMTGNTTFTLPTQAAGLVTRVLVVQDGTGSRVPTFSNVRWAGGSAPTWTTTSNHGDEVEFACYDGSTIQGRLLAANIDCTAPPFDPTTISGLILWWEGRNSNVLFQDTAGTTPATADGDPVGLWKDASTTAYSVQASSNKPTLRTGANGINGQNALSFNGTTSNLANNSNGPTLKPVTLIAVINPTTVNAAHAILASQVAGGLEYRISNTGHMDAVEQEVADIAASSGTLTAATAALVTFTYDSSGNYVHRINRSVSGSGTNNLSIGTNGMSVGSARNAFDFFSGLISGIWAWNRVLTGTEVGTAESALAALYGTP